MFFGAFVCFWCYLFTLPVVDFVLVSSYGCARFVYVVGYNCRHGWFYMCGWLCGNIFVSWWFCASISCMNVHLYALLCFALIYFAILHKSTCIQKSTQYDAQQLSPILLIPTKIITYTSYTTQSLQIQHFKRDESVKS